MKINKILAAGVAATLAVTSLSAVASAETKSYTWKMDYTFSKIQWNNLKLQWLNDNDYIKAERASYAVGITNFNTELAKVIANGTGLQYATAAKLVASDTTAIKLDGTFKTLGANGGGDSAVELAAAGDVPAAIATLDALYVADLKAAKVQLDPAIAQAAAAVADPLKMTTALEEDIERASRTALQYLDDARTQLDKLKTAANAQAADATVYTAAVKANYIAHLDAAKARLNAVADLLDAAIKVAEEKPLLKDTEVGGMFIDTSAKPITLDGKQYFVKVSGAKLTIKGTKRGSTANESFSTDFKQAYKSYKADLTGNVKDDNYIFTAFAPKYVNREGFNNLNVFGTITDASVDVSWKLYERNTDGTVGAEVEKFTEAEYEKVKKTTMETLRGLLNIDYIDTNVATPNDVDTWVPATQDAAGKSTLTKTPGELADLTTALYKLYYGLDKSLVSGEVTENSDSKKTLKPFLKMTTGTEGATIYRDNVLALSYTDAYKSLTINDKRDFNQTYDDAGMGTAPKWFAGLASQCADFFDKQNNGQVIFKFQDPATADKWVSYGVPSTEVGLRTLQGTAMALFFNYTTSTGSIQTIGVVDKDAWTITFDMATVLDDFGTRTKATLEDIYYGLNTGLQYGDPYNGKGYVVETVTLQYDDAPAAVDATTDDDAAVVVADDDDDDVVADDDDDDVFADDDVVADDDDDDDDDAGIIEDDDDDDTDVNNDVDYVDGADDDANPGTGVGLAVIPAIVAAAAAIVSKKRK